jgi:succinate-semialdehyde dehydrogenase/glutarate-semialdehyde dehydrogenase
MRDAFGLPKASLQSHNNQMSYQTINPYDQSVLKTYEHLPLAQAFEDVKKIHAHQTKWREKTVEQRAEVVKKLAGAIRNRKEEMAKQATLEMGKPISQGLGEVEKCAKTLEMVADMAVGELKQKELNAHYEKTFLVPEPYGLVFSVQPWNFPYWQLYRMAACAWMAGNLVVLKHSDSVSGCADLIQKACDESGEKLLLNLKLSHEDAAEIIKSKWISAVTLTGSTKAGKEIGRVAGESLKKQVLELGGSDAYIVMEDCDLQASAAACAKARLINSGQSCIAAKRFFVHEKIYSEFKNLLLENLRKAKVGSPLDDSTEVGPLASKKFVEQIQKQIEKAKSAGAEFSLAQDPFEGRDGFSPIGVLDFGTKLKAFEDEEVFGPVASLYRYSAVEDVVEAINSGAFGLGGGIFSTDIQKAVDLAKKIESGTLTINTWVQSDARVPFGGRKDSGLSYELGVIGINEFTHWKVIGQKNKAG